MPKEKNANRHQSRTFAFQILYGLSFAAKTTLEELKEAYSEYPKNEDDEQPQEQPTPELPTEPTGFAWELVHGVWSHQKEIDTHIRNLSQNWRFERIGHIERTLLRLAFFELFYEGSTPPKVIFKETLELSKQFAEVSAKKFISGILEAAIKEHKTAQEAGQNHTQDSATAES